MIVTFSCKVSVRRCCFGGSTSLAFRNSGSGEADILELMAATIQRYLSQLMAFTADISLHGLPRDVAEEFS